MNYYYIGLGNPGDEYVFTRHNAGQILLQTIAKTMGALRTTSIDTKKTRKDDIDFPGASVSFIYPGCYMNDSGGVVKRLRAPENMLVIVYDDIDIPFGEIRLSYNKSGGSHNGVLSIVKQLGTQKFITLRVGVSQKDSLGRMRRISGAGKVQEFVMKNFSHDELTHFEMLAQTAINTMKLLHTHGLEKTLSIYKTKKADAA